MAGRVPAFQGGFSASSGGGFSSGGGSPNPARAKPLHTCHLTGHTDLHAACASRKGAAEVLAALQASPESARVRCNEGALPLHLAVRARAPLEVVRALLAADGSGAAEADCEGRTPLHHALSFFPSNHEAEDSTALLPAGTLVRPSALAPFDYSLATPREPTLEPFGGALGVVVKASPHLRAPYLVAVLGQLSKYQWYERGELVRCEGLPAEHEVVEALLAAAPEALQQRDGCGRLPLHLAAGGAVSAEIFERVLRAGQADDGSQRDDQGLYPLHHAAAQRAPTAT